MGVLDDIPRYNNNNDYTTTTNRNTNESQKGILNDIPRYIEPEPIKTPNILDTLDNMTTGVSNTPFLPQYNKQLDAELEQNKQYPTTNVSYPTIDKLSAYTNAGLDSSTLGIAPLIESKLAPDMYKYSQDVQTENPKSAMAGKLTGYLLPGALAEKAAIRAMPLVFDGLKPLTALAAKGISSGAIMGGIEGLTGGIKDNMGVSDTLSNMGNNAYDFGLMGGAVSPLIHSTINGIGKGINNISEGLNNSIDNTLTNPLQGASDLTSQFEKPYLPVNLKTLEPNKFTVKPIEAEKAMQNYNDAVETLQNKYGTKDIQGAISDIVNNNSDPLQRKINVDNNYMKDYIKQNDGIDLDKLISDMELTQKGSGSMIPTSEQSRLYRTAGLAPEKSYDLTRRISEYENNPQILNEKLQAGKINPVESNLNPQINQGNVNSPLLRQNQLESTTIQNNDIPNKSVDLGGNNPSILNVPLENGEKLSKLSDNVNNLQDAMGADKYKKLDKMINEKNPTNTNYKYVDSSPITFDEGLISDKATAKDVVKSYTEKMNKQIITGHHLAEDINKNLMPEIKDRESLSLLVDAGSKQHIQNVLTRNPEWLDSKMPSGKQTYREAYNGALKLDETSPAYKEAKQYYDESGKYAQQMGTTKSQLENYVNRLYKPETKTMVKTELGKKPINTFSSHSKARVYDTIDQAKDAGKEFATHDISDNISIHNEEMAKVNTNRKLADALQKTGFGGYVNSGSIPEGFKSIESLKKDIPIVTEKGNIVDLKNGDQAIRGQEAGIMRKEFVVPEGMADGLKVITENVGKQNWFDKAQGIVKTYDLAMSTFHHITEAAQMLYQSKGGLELLKGNGIDGKLFDFTSPDFQTMEKDFVGHDGMTSKLESNQDIMRRLNPKDGILGKVMNTPGLKQFNNLIEKNNELLFGKMQRWLKVTDYGRKVSNYLGKNPNVSEEALITAKRQIAREVNAAYGGLNWKTLGISENTLRTMRRWILAPDWTYSNIEMAKLQFSKGPGGNAARAHLATALTGGLLLTEGLNKMFTGHFTDQNPKGHEMEVEISPGVYVSAFRGFIGDALSLRSKIATDGIIGGTSRFLQNKLAPLARTTLGEFTNIDSNGAPIRGKDDSPIKKDLKSLAFVGKSALPIPFGVSSLTQYLRNGDVTPQGAVAVGLGAARYAADKTQKGSVYDNPNKSYEGNFIHDWLSGNEGRTSANLVDQIKSNEKQKVDQNKLVREDIGKALKDNPKANVGDILNKYNIPPNERQSLITTSKNKLATIQQSDLTQKYLSMSALDRRKFYNSLDANSKQVLTNDLAKSNKKP